MKAAQISEYGGLDVINVVDRDKPILSPGQVLVEVHAASLNPFDTTVREGGARSMKQLDFPATLGGDMAGVIAEVGVEVNGVAVGDKIYGQASLFGGGSGAFAEFATTNPSQIAKMPQNLSFDQAASLPLTGVAALQGLREHIGLQAGQKILIQGGSGGIGGVAIQLAKHTGAYVATTVSPEGADYAKKLGADEVIDYKSQDFTQIISCYDAVFDMVGGEVFDKSIDVLKSGGRAVTMVGPVNEEHAAQKEVTAVAQGTEVSTKKLEELRELVERGTVKQNADKIFSLEQIREAFQARESSGLVGKVVLKVK